MRKEKLPKGYKPELDRKPYLPVGFFFVTALSKWWQRMRKDEATILADNLSGAIDDYYSVSGEYQTILDECIVQEDCYNFHLLVGVMKSDRSIINMLPLEISITEMMRDKELTKYLSNEIGRKVKIANRDDAINGVWFQVERF